MSGRLTPPAGLAYLVAAFVGSSFLGLAYIFSSRPFYSFYEHAPRLWGLSPIRDQNLGGILMNGEQTLVFLLCDRLVRAAAARRGARAGAGATFGYIAEAGASVAPCSSRSS